jgi:hypothetical protein
VKSLRITVASFTNSGDRHRAPAPFNTVQRLPEGVDAVADFDIKYLHAACQ